MNPTNCIRRHPFILLASLLAIGVTAWVGYVLATFDLNQYREELAHEIGTRLQMPVRLGTANLELREAGVAFHFTELRIGTGETRFELKTEKFWLQLAWHGLLLGKPIFTEAALEAPHLRIAPTPPPPPGEAPAPGSFTTELLRGIQIRRIEIQHGTVDVSWRDQAGQVRNIKLSDLAADIANLGQARTALLDVSAQLHQGVAAARLSVKGSLDLPETGGMRDAILDLDLEAKAVNVAMLAGYWQEQTGIDASGMADLALFLKGKPGEALTVQAELSGQDLRVRPGAAFRKPVPLQRLQLTGTWQQAAAAHRFRELAISLDDLRLAGEVSADRHAAGGWQLDGTIKTGTFPVDTLRRWLPDRWQEEPFLARLRPGGSIELAQALFRAEVPAAPGESGSFSLLGAAGEAKTLAWSVGSGSSAELTRLGFRLSEGRWHLENGAAAVAGLAVSLTGTVSPHPNLPAEIDCSLGFQATAGQLAALGGTPLPAGMALAGDVTAQARLTGTTDQYLFTAQADLSRLDYRYGERVHLPPSPGSQLSVQGQGSSTALSIGQGTLALAALRGTLSGGVDWSAAPTANLAGRVELADLTGAYGYAPELEKLQLRGGMALDFAAQGPLATLRPQLSLDLADVSIPTHGIVADISHLTGRLTLEEKSLHGEKLTAQLGKSPVTLQAHIADLGAPRLELGVKAPSMRADELIFRSDRRYLRDLDGRLIFDRDSIAFAPVTVRLDGGTRATINGSVSNFAAPQVDLDITGEYAHVEEIIALWTDESPAAEALRHEKHPKTPHRPLPPIRIKVDAREGDLYSMKFARAKALIVPTSEHLLIHPLTFNIEEGYCTAQVLVDFTGSATVLRVSGHAEDVDAYQVYNELLNQKSIMRGRLRGDFYLQGELGRHGFLPTSYGNIRATVHDGVMRYSPIMSNLFSLLNVSQLFNFELPDVNLEGVPFTRLETELAIDKGVMSTEHMVAESNAVSMSYLGNFDMVHDRLDLLVVAKPLGTVDKVVTRLPIAGWILGGDERALVTAQFKVTGSAHKPDVEAIPISAMSKGVLGIFQRTLGLPLKMIDDPAILWGGGGEKK